MGYRGPVASYFFGCHESSPGRIAIGHSFYGNFTVRNGKINMRSITHDQQVTRYTELSSVSGMVSR